MRAFIGDCVRLVHDLTSHAATVGSASTRSLSLVRDLGLDVYQAHWYDRLNRHAPLDLPVPAHGLDRPLILGEFPTRGSRRLARLRGPRWRTMRRPTGARWRRGSLPSRQIPLRTARAPDAARTILFA
jgi:hypothetical protein